MAIGAAEALVACGVVIAWAGSADPVDPRLPTPVTRTSLRVAAFGSSRLPTTLPAVQRNWPDGRFGYAKRIDRLTVRLPHGFTSVSYELWPRVWNGRTMIFHNGHGQGLDASPKVLEWFVARGWRVVSMAMPFAGQNASPGFKRTPLHDQLASLQRPLELFLLPVVAVINLTHADVMIGLSGGGWTTVVAAAIDPRIGRSYSVAGTIPWEWRCPPGGPGCSADLEQRMIPNYIRLYELGSQPPQRQMALYNLDDPCCFAGRSAEKWGSTVRGNFGTAIDMSSHRHEVSEFHLRVITHDLGSSARASNSEGLKR